MQTLNQGLLSFAIAACCTPAFAAETQSYRYGVPEWTDETPYCIVELQPAGSTELPALPRCYATVAEVVADETEGRVLLPMDTTQEEEEQYRSVINEATSSLPIPAYLLSIQYKGKNFKGPYLKFNGRESCEIWSYEVSTLEEEWDDKISSLETFSDCTSTNYKDPYLSGRSFTCPVTGCADLDYMNNKTSSIKLQLGFAK